MTTGVAAGNRVGLFRYHNINVAIPGHSDCMTESWPRRGPYPLVLGEAPYYWHIVCLRGIARCGSMHR